MNKMKSGKPILILIALISLMSFSGSLGQSQPAAKTIEIKDFSFQPSSISVPVGTSVTWVNHDQASHTITSDDGKFDSGTMKNGAEFNFTFFQPGTYSYHCNIHPSMNGMVTVTSA
jgi:plastocyanin